MALSRGHRAHHKLNLAFRKHGDLGAFARGTAGDLEIIGDADTSQPAAFSCLGAPGRKSIPIGERQCSVHSVFVVEFTVHSGDEILRDGERAGKWTAAEASTLPSPTDARS